MARNDFQCPSCDAKKSDVILPLNVYPQCDVCLYHKMTRLTADNCGTHKPSKPFD